MIKKSLSILLLSLGFVAVIASCSKKQDVTQEEQVSVVEEKSEYGLGGSDFGQAGPLQSIHFAFDSYALSDEAKQILDKNAEWLIQNPNIYIQIEGHCDERGTIEYNLALGEKRAETAKQYLISKGVDPSRISIISYGEEKPLDPRHNEEAWAKNRRDNFVIVSY